METSKISAIATIIAAISIRMKELGLNTGIDILIKPELIIMILDKLHHNNISVLDIDKSTENTYFHSKSWSENGELTGIVFQGNIINQIIKLIDTIPLNQYLSKSEGLEMNSGQSSEEGHNLQ